MIFNDHIKSEAIKTIDRIMSHPISSPFRQPFASKAIPAEYFEKAKSLCDLTTVKNKILKGEINTIQQWFDDMELIWTNAETFFAKDHAMQLLINENRRLFHKEKKILFGQSIRQWCGNVYDLRTEITDIMNEPPSKIKQFADTLGAARSMKPNQQVMNERDLQNFLKATELMTSDEDQKNLIEKLSKFQPELDTGSTDLTIDTSKLNPDTIQALKEYMEQSLENKGKKYPDSI